MFGIVIAFQRYSPSSGFFGSEWVGLQYFKSFFNDFFFLRLIRNTFLLSLYSFLIGFPAPIILALLLNEIKFNKYKRVVQTVTYMPHFIAMTVIVGILRMMLKQDGVINLIRSYFGLDSIIFLARAEYFRTILIASDVLQGVGYGSIVFLAAIASLGSEIYEAAYIDGAGRFKQCIHLTIPGILPTISYLMIFRLSGMLSYGAGKIILLYNPAVYETGDVIGSYVYRKGILEGAYSSSAAVGLFNSVVALILLVTTNWVARKLGEYSLW